MEVAVSEYFLALDTLVSPVHNDDEPQARHPNFMYGTRPVQAPKRADKER
jgi:hypothetical protein